MNISDKINFSSCAQYGSRSKSSCDDFVNHVTDYMRGNVDPSFTGQNCFLDITKFDTINVILLTNLDYYGFRGVAKELRASYLNGRRQYSCWDERNYK